MGCKVAFQKALTEYNCALRSAVEATTDPAGHPRMVNDNDAKDDDNDNDNDKCGGSSPRTCRNSRPGCPASAEPGASCLRPTGPYRLGLFAPTCVSIIPDSMPVRIQEAVWGRHSRPASSEATACERAARKCRVGLRKSTHSNHSGIIPARTLALVPGRHRRVA